MAEGEAGIGDGRVIEDRYEARRAGHRGAVEQCLVPVRQTDEIDVAFKIVGLRVDVQKMLEALQEWEANASPGVLNLQLISTGTVEVNRAMNLRSSIILDQNFQAGSAFGAHGTPMAVLLDAKGRIASEVVAGAETILALTASTGGDGVRHHFSGSSLILSPPLATGTTQIGVASADELRSET